MRKKQKFKCHGFGFDLQVYEKLREYGFRNEDIQILAQNPSKFFAHFQKYSIHIPEELKNKAYMFCLREVLNKSQKKEVKQWETFSNS